MQVNIFNIPCGHHILIIQKIKNQKEAIFFKSSKPDKTTGTSGTGNENREQPL